MSSDIEPTMKEQLECQKLQFEIEKTQLETAELKRSWYKRPQWISAILPPVLGILTICIAWVSGFLNKQALVNRNESVLLQIQIKEFTKQRDSLFYERDSLRKEDSILRFMISKLQRDKSRLEKLIADAPLEESKRNVYLLFKNRELYDKIEDTVAKLNDRAFMKSIDFGMKEDDYRARLSSCVDKLEDCKRENKMLGEKLKAADKQ